MEIYLDTMPIGNPRYIVGLIDKTDNTISVLGCDNNDDLSYRGLNNIGKLSVGEQVTTYDDEGNECEITRLH